jgi:RNA polymerase sigma-70 factor (ECF subfamily)
MDAHSASRTSVSLLGRLHRNPADPGAWQDFVQRYGRKIYLWCRGWGLQDADAQDVTQNVLLEIARQMKTFTYDPSRSFRAWLKTVAHGAWHDLVHGRQFRNRGSGDSDVRDRLQATQARDDLARQLEEQYDADLLEEATARVRGRVETRTWEAFSLLVYEELPGAEVAARLEMKVGAVYMAKSRVQKLLQEEIRLLDSEGEVTP